MLERLRRPSYCRQAAEAHFLDCEEPDAEQTTEAEAARQTYFARKWAQFYRALRRLAFRRKRWHVEGQWLNALKCRADGREHFLLR